MGHTLICSTSQCSSGHTNMHLHLSARGLHIHPVFQFVGKEVAGFLSNCVPMRIQRGLQTAVASSTLVGRCEIFPANHVTFM